MITLETIIYKVSFHKMDSLYTFERMKCRRNVSALF